MHQCKQQLTRLNSSVWAGVSALFSVVSSLRFSYRSGGHFRGDLRSSQADHRGTVRAIHMGTVQGETMKAFRSFIIPSSLPALFIDSLIFG